MPLLPNSFSFFKIILKILIQLILIIYYSFPQLFFVLTPTHTTSCSFSFNKTSYNWNSKAKAQKSPWNPLYVGPGELLLYPLSIHCRKLLFSISDQLSVTDSFLFWGVGFSAACFLWQELVYLGLYRSCSSCLYCWIHMCIDPALSGTVYCSNFWPW